MDDDGTDLLDDEEKPGAPKKTQSVKKAQSMKL